MCIDGAAEDPLFVFLFGGGCCLCVFLFLFSLFLVFMGKQLPVSFLVLSLVCFVVCVLLLLGTTLADSEE